MVHFAAYLFTEKNTFIFRYQGATHTPDLDEPSYSGTRKRLEKSKKNKKKFARLADIGNSLLNPRGKDFKVFQQMEIKCWTKSAKEQKFRGHDGSNPTSDFAETTCPDTQESSEKSKKIKKEQSDKFILPFPCQIVDASELENFFSTWYRAFGRPRRP